MAWNDNGQWSRPELFPKGYCKSIYTCRNTVDLINITYQNWNGFFQSTSFCRINLADGVGIKRKCTQTINGVGGKSDKTSAGQHIQCMGKRIGVGYGKDECLHVSILAHFG